MDAVRERYAPKAGLFTRSVLVRLKERFMQDLAYIGLTILVFAVLFLIVRGVERFERQ
jgi:hypothetical protein